MPLELSPEVTQLEAYRAQTERLKVLLAFLASPLQAPKDHADEPDPDVLSAYNLAIAATLQHVRQLVQCEHRGRV